MPSYVPYFSAQKKRKVKKAYAKKKVKVMPIRALVRQEIARNVENKTTGVYNGAGLYDSSTSSLFLTRNVVPMGFAPTAFNLTQGTGQGARIGNKVKIKKMTYKSTFYPSPYDAVSNLNPCPLQVRLLFVSQKDQPAEVPGYLGDLFQFAGTTSGPVGNLTDMWAPINLDRFSVYGDKVFKLGPSQNGDPTAAFYPTLSSPIGLNVNNDFKLNVNVAMDLKKMFPETVTFNDNSAAATSRMVSMIVLLARADCFTTSGSQTLVKSQYICDVQYEDA